MNNDKVFLPAQMIPSFRTMQAYKKGTQKRILLRALGGLGDVVCAEPAIRWALKNFTEYNIYLATHYPELFEHLEFDGVISPEADCKNFLVIDSLRSENDLLAEFMSHMMVNPVDYASICMFKRTIPIEDKVIKLPDFDFIYLKDELDLIDFDLPYVAVHAGKHWESKTLPIEWYNSFIRQLKEKGLRVILVGKKVDENVGYVDVDSSDCLDLRDKLSIDELTYLLKRVKAVFTNDSAPLHIACSGKAFVGFIATCKHPDHLMHWRRNAFGKEEFGHKMKNFGLDGAWNHVDSFPHQNKTVSLDKLPEGLMCKVLPDPSDVAKYYQSLLISL